MAKSNSPLIYSQTHDRNRSMRRTTAPPVGGSRIPVYNAEKSRHQSAPHQPRLEEMQARNRDNILRKKEEKMIGMYERQQEEALRKVSNYAQPSQNAQKKGIVRDFFRERREMTAQSELMPTANDHFQRIKSEKERSTFNKVSRPSQIPRGSTQSTQTRAGISRSKPLPSLNRQNSRNPHNPPTPNGHDKTNEDMMEKKEYNPQPQINRAQKPTSKLPPTGKNAKNGPPVKLGKHNKLPNVASRENIRIPQENVSRPTQEKLSDFQKWQMEQDKKRDERLQQYQDKLRDERQQEVYTGSGSSDNYWNRDEMNTDATRAAERNRRQQEYDDIRRKEKELEDLIAKRQAELNRYPVDEDDLANSPRYSSKSNHMPAMKNAKRPVAKTKQLDINQNISNPKNPYVNGEEDYYNSNLDNRRNDISKSDQDYYYKDESPIRTPIQHNSPKQAPKEAKSPLKQFKLPARQTKQQPLRKPPPPKKQDPYVSPFDSYYREPTPDVSFYAKAAEEAVDNPQLSLKQCPSCGRKFQADRLAKHLTVCKKSSKPRKVFDMTKKRTEGTEAAQYVRRGIHLKEPKQTQKSDWREKHEDFQRTVREARKMQAYVAKGGNLADLPPPPPSKNLDYKACPYCKRRFNPTVAERHIPKCKDIKSRPPPVKRR